MSSLQPFIQEIESRLLQNLGSYVQSVLEVPGLEDLQPLVQLKMAAKHQSLSFVAAFLQLQSAAGAICNAQTSGGSDAASIMQVDEPTAPPAATSSSSDGGLAAAQAHTGVRDAVMRLIADKLAPARLHVPLLFYILPFLESPHQAFSVADMQQLMTCLSDITLSHVAPVLLQKLHPRNLQDVQLALTRGLAKSLVMGGM